MLIIGILHITYQRTYPYTYVTYIYIPIDILRSTPDVAAWSCQRVESRRSDHAKLDDFNTRSKHGSAPRIGSCNWTDVKRKVLAADVFNDERPLGFHATVLRLIITMTSGCTNHIAPHDSITASHVTSNSTWTLYHGSIQSFAISFRYFMPLYYTILYSISISAIHIFILYISSEFDIDNFF